MLRRDPDGNELPKSLMNRVIFFQKKQKKDTIDVWWLSDDGGNLEALKKKKKDFRITLNFIYYQA